jgi:hypothetical protein
VPVDLAVVVSPPSSQEIRMARCQAAPMRGGGTIGAFPQPQRPCPGIDCDGGRLAARWRKAPVRIAMLAQQGPQSKARRENYPAHPGEPDAHDNAGAITGAGSAGYSSHASCMPFILTQNGTGLTRTASIGTTEIGCRQLARAQLSGRSPQDAARRVRCFTDGCAISLDNVRYWMFQPASGHRNGMGVCYLPQQEPLRGARPNMRGASVQWREIMMHQTNTIAHNREVERRLDSLERAGVGLVCLSWLLLVGGSALALIGVLS